jgi:PAS domain S-box-containing protein
MKTDELPKQGPDGPVPPDVTSVAAAGGWIPARALAPKIALAYAFVSSLWIFFSGQLLHRLVHDPDTLMLLENVKGWLFVLVTAGLLYWTLGTYFQQIRRSAHRLQDSEERLRLATEAALMGTWDRDLKTGQLFWSAIQERLMGYEPGTFPGTPEAFLELLHPDSVEAHAAAQQRARKGDGRFEAELHYRLRDGRERWGFLSGKMILDGQGKPARLVGVQLDITQRKQSEEVVRRLNADLEQRVRDRTAQLEAANKELEAFSFSVSHDLRAPLRGIDGWSQALQEDCAPQLDERGRQFLSRIRAETVRMARLIDDLLQLSRVSRAEMAPGPVDLSALAEAVANRLREAEPDRPMQFVIQPGLTVHGDARLLEIALTNLLGNAAKFTGPRNPARIEFGRAEQAGRSVFFVRDNGVGFNMAYASRLFGAFQRLHPMSEFPGTGIGLATVQRVLHRHGGQIWAEAELGQGATFSFVFDEKS